MADDYVELFLTWGSAPDQAAVRAWLEQRQLSTTKMKSGLLLLGTKHAIEHAFAISLDDLQPPAELPVPAELKDQVASINLPRPRSYNG